LGIKSVSSELKFRLSSLPLVLVAEVKPLFYIGHCAHLAQQPRGRNWLTRLWCMLPRL